MASPQHPRDSTETPWQRIDEAIADGLGEPFSTLNRSPVSGGCISETWRLEGRDRAIFIKLESVQQADQLTAEADGLAALAASKTFRVPDVISLGQSSERAWLALEFIETGPANASTAIRLGEQLAALHNLPQTQFGWHRNNWIGATPQPNGEDDNWTVFYREQRLEAQLELAAANGASSQLIARGERLADMLDVVMSGHSPTPSLLHGDLWGGNWACDSSGNPFVFDPACYRGDAETDIAMTTLFGGFPTAFYTAYESVRPRQPGYELRQELYNLYHVLNHFNVFGGGYDAQALSMINALLAEIGMA